MAALVLAGSSLGAASYAHATILPSAALLAPMMPVRAAIHDCQRARAVRLSEEAPSPLEEALETPTATEEYVRPPPDYPDGLHDPAKADREGPFWSSLGEPDVSTGVRPAYLRRDDWHISSTYTPGERQAVEDAEAEWISLASVVTPDDDAIDTDATAHEVEDEDEDFDPFAEKEHMRLEPGLASGAKPSDMAMPGSWQEYQFLQQQLEVIIADGGPAAAQASVHAKNMDDFYLTFKDILAQGWQMLNNVEIEAAVRFLLQETQTSAPKSGKTEDETFNPPE